MLAPEDGRVGTPPGFPVRSSHPETWPCLPHAPHVSLSVVTHHYYLQCLSCVSLTSY